MIDLQATPDELVDAVVDAMKHDDQPAVFALTIALTRLDRAMAERLVRSSDFRMWWELRDWRRRYLA